jgi:uncharacterized alpha-E superfamily protein
LQAARENARGVREVISSGMWLQLNKFYLMVKLASAAPPDLDQATEFFHEVILASQLFAGITDASMTHSAGWHFSQIGRMLERADKVSRILDMKYYILLRSPEDVGTSFDHIQWGAVLRSASAFEMYCKRHGRILPLEVVSHAGPGVSPLHSVLFAGGARFAACHLRHSAGRVPLRAGETPGPDLRGLGICHCGRHCSIRPP